MLRCQQLVGRQSMEPKSKTVDRMIGLVDIKIDWSVIFIWKLHRGMFNALPLKHPRKKYGVL